MLVLVLSLAAVHEVSPILDEVVTLPSLLLLGNITHVRQELGRASCTAAAAHFSAFLPLCLRSHYQSGLHGGAVSCWMKPLIHHDRMRLVAWHLLQHGSFPGKRLDDNQQHVSAVPSDFDVLADWKPR